MNSALLDDLSNSVNVANCLPVITSTCSLQQFGRY
jgi:hypothetical protein